eukprot:2814286-Amphidinium_carterae.1
MVMMMMVMMMMMLMLMLMLMMMMILLALSNHLGQSMCNPNAAIRFGELAKAVEQCNKKAVSTRCPSNCEGSHVF